MVEAPITVRIRISRMGMPNCGRCIPPDKAVKTVPTAASHWKIAISVGPDSILAVPACDRDADRDDRRNSDHPILDRGSKKFEVARQPIADCRHGAILAAIADVDLTSEDFWTG
jgi:hypothetical protein